MPTVIKIKDNALEIHEETTIPNPNIPDGKQQYARLLGEVVGKTVYPLRETDEEGYVVRTPYTGKKIVIPERFIEEKKYEYNDIRGDK